MDVTPYEAYVDLNFESVENHLIHISTKIIFGLYHLPMIDKQNINIFYT